MILSYLVVILIISIYREGVVHDVLPGERIDIINNLNLHINVVHGYGNRISSIVYLVSQFTVYLCNRQSHTHGLVLINNQVQYLVSILGAVGNIAVALYRINYIHEVFTDSCKLIQVTSGYINAESRTTHH